jgi:hypothetical protein
MDKTCEESFTFLPLNFSASALKNSLSPYKPFLQMILGWQKKSFLLPSFFAHNIYFPIVNEKNLVKKVYNFARLFYTMHMWKKSSFCIGNFTKAENENSFARAETARFLINPQVKQPCRIV